MAPADERQRSARALRGRSLRSPRRLALHLP